VGSRTKKKKKNTRDIERDSRDQRGDRFPVLLACLQSGMGKAGVGQLLTHGIAGERTCPYGPRECSGVSTKKASRVGYQIVRETIRPLE